MSIIHLLLHLVAEYKIHNVTKPLNIIRLWFLSAKQRGQDSKLGPRDPWLEYHAITPKTICWITQFKVFEVQPDGILVPSNVLSKYIELIFTCRLQSSNHGGKKGEK